MAKIEITKDMLVGDIVNNIEGAAGALMESLENACMVHGLNVAEVLATVNAAVQ